MGGGGIILKLIYFQENQGHGRARDASLANSSYEFVALMDSDDISLPCRFEIELKKFLEDGSLAVVGGQIEEFVEDQFRPVSKRQVCISDIDIKRDMKHRCPMNQMSVMMRKSDVYAVGGYQDWFCNEDYFLWIRMALSKLRFANVPETLVKVRVNNGFYGRRGGLRYFKSEVGIQKLMLSVGLINPCGFIVNVVVRFVSELLLPQKIRQKVFNRFARRKCE